MEGIVELPVEGLKPNRWNVNFLLDHERMRLRDYMAGNPRNVPPIIVREADGYYEIIDGEQRWRIALELGWRRIPALVRRIDEEEAKRLCLSYNMLRGRVDWFKLAEIMAGEAERGVNLESAYSSLLSPHEIRVLLALNRLDDKARNMLRRTHLQRPIPLSHLEVIARFPREIQPKIAEITVERDLGLGGLRHLLEIYMRGEGEAGMEEAEAEEEEDEEASAPTMDEELRGSVEEDEGEIGGVHEPFREEAALFICECGFQYRVDFERRAVERVRREMGMDILKLEATLPAMIEVECPRCGAKGEVDVSGGEIKWTLK